MNLGKLSDYKKLYDPKDHGFSTPEKLNKAKLELATNLVAFQYFKRVPGAIHQKNKPSLDADFLIACGNDFGSVIPDGAEFKAFKKNQDLGFVLVNKVNKALSLYDPTEGTSRTATRNGLSYELVGNHGGNDIFARLDRTAITDLHAGSRLSAGNLDAYETSMRKGVIPSGSTGSDGIKFDNGTWVIKLTISIATAQGVDNSLSPMADEDRDTANRRIFLNFDQLTMRH